jgi:hypothetical protein
MAKKRQVSDEVKALEARVAELEKELAAHRVYAHGLHCFIDEIVNSMTVPTKAAWRVNSLRRIRQLQAMKGRDLKYIDERIAEAIEVRDNPNEVKARANEVREDLSRRASLQAGDSPLVG